MKNKLFSLTSAVHFGILIYVSKYNMYGKAARLFPDSLAAVLLSFVAFFGCVYSAVKQFLFSFVIRTGLRTVRSTF